jgi:predicted HTH transcriptional regulator
MQGVSTEKVQEAAVAFSNAQGGVILVGVDPSGAPKGLSQPGEQERKLHHALQGVRNCGRYETGQLTVGTKTILVVRIERRHEGPRPLEWCTRPPRDPSVSLRYGGLGELE